MRLYVLTKQRHRNSEAMICLTGLTLPKNRPVFRPPLGSSTLVNSVVIRQPQTNLPTFFALEDPGSTPCTFEGLRVSFSCNVWGYGHGLRPESLYCLLIDSLRVLSLFWLLRKGKIFWGYVTLKLKLRLVCHWCLICMTEQWGHITLYESDSFSSSAFTVERGRWH